VAATSTVLDALAESLTPLWDTLSLIISRIESNLPERTSRAQGDLGGPQGGDAEPGGLGGSGSGVLPPAAPQILPLVEAFFVLCEARTALQRAARPEDGASSPEVDAAGLPFQRFSEQHRRLLNTLVQQNPNLLEGSLAPLLRTPRLIEFDNKRAYFQSQMRSSREDRYHGGTLRISVLRDHTFEDSFHQLRMRTPDEMRCKLSVQFQGEEGIDAGGVSREWYQVRSPRDLPS
jgi:E3 ubiquitin-protein ligase HUWE1